MFVPDIYSSGLSAAVLACVLLLPGVAGAIAPPGKPQIKLALVVGAGAYPFHPLTNPPGDAGLIADKLKTLDAFTDVKLLNEQGGKILTRDALSDAVSTLARRAKDETDGGKDVTVFFYFAGHGVEADGESRLVPPSAVSLLGPEPDPGRIEAETVSAQGMCSINW